MSKTGFKKGRLGIGTDNPRYPLDVVGDIRLTGGFRDASGNDFNFLAINNVDYIKQEDINGITSSNNKIGILNTDPSEELDVSGNINFTGTLKQNGVAFGGGKFQDAATSGDIYYTSGKVGIGYASPAHSLEVRTSSGWAGAFKGEDNDVMVYIAQKGYGLAVDSKAQKSSTSYIAKFRGSTNGTTIGNRPIMDIMNSGNVGIGTDNPGQKLEVKTDISFDGIILNNEDGGLLFKAARSNGKTRAYFGLYDGTTSAPQGKVVFRNDDDSYINTGGNVGIGTTDPGNFKLKIYNSTGTNTNGSNGWHNHFCVEEQTMAGSGVTFKAGTQTGYIYYGSSTGNPWVGSGSFGFATTATGNSSDIKMVLKNDGNVGIGTPSPGSILELSKSLSTYDDYSFMINFKNTYSTWYDWSIGPYAHDGSARFGIRGGGDGFGNLNTLFTIKADNGNVGIGTRTPEYIIDLADDSFIGGTPVSSQAKYIRFITSNTTGNTSGGIVWKTNYGGDYTKTSASIEAICENNYFRQGLAFFTGNETHTTNPTERMRIDMDGYVGIGTTDPDARLHVEVPGYGEPIAKFSGVGDTFILIEGGRTNDWDEVGVVIRGMPTGGYWLAGVDDSSTYQIKYDSSDFHFGNEGVGLAITTDGKVGIGTTTFGDTRALLHLKPNAGIAFQASTSSSVNSRNWRLRPDDYGPWGTLGFYCGGTNTDYADDESECVMCLTHERRMGIGTMSPGYKLDVNGNGRFKNHLRIDGESSNNTGDAHLYISKSTNNDWAIKCEHYDYDYGIALHGTGDHAIYITNDGTHSFEIGFNGYVHMIGSWLQVDGYYTPTIGTARYFHRNGANVSSSDSYGAYSLSIWARYGIFSDEHIWAGSDSRIKKDIRAVPDNLALDTLRNIECYYYKYIDGTRGEGDTIGFMAQEVAEKLPIAVKQTEKIIPNIYKVISCNWTSFVETTVDASGKTTSETKYKMSSDEITGDISGVLYRFYLYENDFEDTQDEKEEDIIGNADNTFTFSEKHDTVFCYGYQVNDFHVINKDKLYSLNFSATQELDRQQQADKLRIAELEQEVNELKTIVHALKNHLGLS